MKLKRTITWQCIAPLIGIGALMTGVALADPPPWPDFPQDCQPEHGVCFHQYEGFFDLFGSDFDGEIIYGIFDADVNDFMRENPDGTHFLHFNSNHKNEINDGLYCPVGAVNWEECWPSVIPSKVSVSGLVNLNPDTGNFSATCPYSAQGHGKFMSPSGVIFKVSIILNTVKNPEGGCDIVQLDIKATPTAD